jgi:DNA-directed RNA polymerase subunit M/transcription elongation factor TFIIS
MLSRKIINGESVQYCLKCEKIVNEAGKKYVIQIKEEIRQKTVVISEKIITGPVVEFTCENEECKTGLAYEMVKPPMFGDEDDLILHKCVDCGKVTREGTKIG